ncbi:zinc finger ccch domain-containing protein 69-like isoform x1 [Cystoisospora suis]|uniref:Zinc finger ccch domain-containing protein 69-like isoform x1 n=1 Tax=Cystoisospora suis TaxID=483139 RepID=A0A2C6JSJ3_9APIC|nr:zinc finger ccch domain-containing protein 69-like isoform x1 [Cystoisospora suis]
MVLAHLSPSASTAPPELCRFFARGWCAFGDRCRNSHDTSASAALARKGPGAVSSVKRGGSILHPGPAPKPSGGIIHAGPAPKSLSGSSVNVSLLYARRGAPGIVAAGRAASRCAASFSEERQCSETTRAVWQPETENAPENDRSLSGSSQVALKQENSGEIPASSTELPRSSGRRSRNGRRLLERSLEGTLDVRGSTCTVDRLFSERLATSRARRLKLVAKLSRGWRPVKYAITKEETDWTDEEDDDSALDDIHSKAQEVCHHRKDGRSPRYLDQTSEAFLLAAARRTERRLRVLAAPEAHEGNSTVLSTFRDSCPPQADLRCSPTEMRSRLPTDRPRPESGSRAVRVRSSFLPSRLHQLSRSRGCPGRAPARATRASSRSSQAASAVTAGDSGEQQRSYLSVAAGRALHSPLKTAWVVKGSTEMDTALPAGAVGQTFFGHSLLNVWETQSVSLLEEDLCLTGAQSKENEEERASHGTTEGGSEDIKRRFSEELETLQSSVETEQTKGKGAGAVSTAAERSTRASITTISGLRTHVVVPTAGSSTGSRNSRCSTLLCTNFPRGTCQWGEKCMFLHTLPLAGSLSRAPSTSSSARGSSFASADGSAVVRVMKKTCEGVEKKPSDSTEAHQSSNCATVTRHASPAREPRRRADDYWPRGVCYWFACDFCWIGVACRQSHTAWDGSCLLCGAPDVDDRLEKHLANCQEFHKRQVLPPDSLLQEELHAAMKASCPGCHGPMLPDAESDSDDELDGQRKNNVLAASGILSDCGHAFCCKCILKMGGETYRQENEVRCALCGKAGIVIFTDRLIRDPARFQEIRSKFLNYLKSTRCASYDSGFCRQGSSCRYGHYDISGYIVKSGGSKRLEEGSSRDISDQALVKCSTGARSRSSSSMHRGVYPGDPEVYRLDTESDAVHRPSRDDAGAEVTGQVPRCWLCAARNPAGTQCVCQTKTKRQDIRKQAGKSRGSSVHVRLPALPYSDDDTSAPSAHCSSSRRAKALHLSRSPSRDGRRIVQNSWGETELLRAENIGRSRSRLERDDCDGKGVQKSSRITPRALSMPPRSRGHQKRKETRETESLVGSDLEAPPQVSRSHRSRLSRRRQRWAQPDENEEMPKRSRRHRSCRRRPGQAADGRSAREEDDHSVPRKSAVRGTDVTRSRARESIDGKQGQEKDERGRRRTSRASSLDTQEEHDSDESHVKAHRRTRRARSSRRTKRRSGARWQIQNPAEVFDSLDNEQDDDQIWPSSLCYWFAWDFCWSGKKCDRAHVASDGSCLLCNCENVGRNLDRHLGVCIEFIARQAEKRAAMTTECSICLGPMLPKAAGPDGLEDRGYFRRPEGQEPDSLPWQSCGALSGCGHTFCYRCIDQWVGTHPSSTDVRGDKQCPLCRRVGLIIPTNRLITNPVRFHMMKISFMKYLKSKRCPLFESGFCPQGLNCRHGHYDSSGRLITQEGLSYFAGMYLPAAPRSLPLNSLQPYCAVPYQQYEEEYFEDYETTAMSGLPLFDYLGFAMPQFHPYEVAGYAGEAQPFM